MPWDNYKTTDIILKVIFLELRPFSTFCENCLLRFFNLKTIKDINMRLLLHAHQVMDIILKAIFLELCLFLNAFVKRIIYFNLAYC